jgi:hypothetical protein
MRPLLIALPFAAAIGALLAASCEAGNTGNDLSDGGDGINFTVSGAGGLDTDGACALYEEVGIVKPLHLYIMFDKSASMAGNKWDAAEAGLAAFVDDVTAAGVDVGMRFFPRMPDSTPGCDQAAYKEPTVAFGLLPGNADAIKNAIAGETPNGFGTPMYPALGGAILKSIEIAQANPDHAAAVLLVTDGQPEGPNGTCGGLDPEDPQVVADLAAIGANFNPPIATYVVGLPGVNQDTANLIAAAGDTDEAILVGGNVEDQFREALQKVKGDALPCTYEIPPQVLSGEVALSKVNVERTTSGGDVITIPQDQDCEGEGWRYDNPSMPTLIELCPQTCEALKDDAGSGIRVVLGCATAIK